MHPCTNLCVQCTQVHTKAGGAAFLFKNPLVVLDKVNLTMQEGPCKALAGLPAAKNCITLRPWLLQLQCWALLQLQSC